MAEQQPRPVLITGGGRRIGLALAHHFLQQHQPVIVSYRTPYPAIDGLREAGALCLQADFSSDDGILTFAEAVKSHTAACAPSSTTPATGWRRSREYR
jgi:dihydromonapterin reductase/dihydrofolate reductase